ncbi:MAG: hypothetical protein ABIJ52_00680 [Pseudomonadota bacterium]
MGIIAKIARIDKKLNWSFLGFIFAALFGGIAVYTEFIRDTSPAVLYEILSNAKILDVKEDVTGLNITYNNEDIRKARKTLSVLIVRVTNEGRSPILKTYYDNASPLGLTISSGEIITAEVISATTDYLKQNAGISVRDPSNVAFSQMIIEPNESFTTKLLILNPEQRALTIFPKGKIAGVKKLLLVDRQSEQTKETFISKVVSGSLWVQIVRTLAYVAAFILLLIVVIVPSVYISDKKEKWKRNGIVKQFKSRTDSQLNDLNVELYDVYKRNGLRALKGMKKTLGDDNRLQSFVRLARAFPSETEAIPDLESRSMVIETTSDGVFLHPAFALKSMIKLGLISKVGEKYTRNEERIKAMNEFVRFVVQQQGRNKSSNE